MVAPAVGSPSILGTYQQRQMIDLSPSQRFPQSGLANPASSSFDGDYHSGEKKKKHSWLKVIGGLAATAAAIIGLAYLGKGVVFKNAEKGFMQKGKQASEWIVDNIVNRPIDAVKGWFKK